MSVGVRVVDPCVRAARSVVVLEHSVELAFQSKQSSQLCATSTVDTTTDFARGHVGGRKTIGRLVGATSQNVEREPWNRD